MPDFHSSSGKDEAEPENEEREPTTGTSLTHQTDSQLYPRQ